MNPYAVYINHGNYQTAEWRLDRRYKTMEQAAQRADLLREAYDVRIINESLISLGEFNPGIVD